jgi:hypothetical protein
MYGVMSKYQSVDKREQRNNERYLPGSNARHPSEQIAFSLNSANGKDILG